MIVYPRDMLNERDARRARKAAKKRATKNPFGGNLARERRLDRLMTATLQELRSITPRWDTASARWDANGGRVMRIAHMIDITATANGQAARAPLPVDRRAGWEAVA